MKQQLKIEFKRAFCTKKYWTIIIFEVIIVGIHFFHIVYPGITEAIPHLMQYMGIKTDFLPGALYYWIGLNNSMERSILFATMPIICAIPYGASVYEDYTSLYQNHYLLRENRKTYFLSKLITMFINGGSIAVFPFALSLYVNIIALPVEETLLAQGYFSSYNEQIAFSGLFVKNPIGYCFIYMIFIFIGFGLINCICYTCSFILSGNAIVMISPFVVYFSTFVLMEFKGNIPVPWQFMRFNDIKKDDVGIVIAQLFILFIVPLLAALHKSRKQGDIL